MIKKATFLYLLVFAGFITAQTFDWAWKNPTPYGNTFNGVVLPSNNTALVFGDAGIIVKSTANDFAGSAVYPDAPTGRTIYDACSIGNTIYACGSSGLLLKSTDLGETWTQLNSGTTKALYDIALIDADTLYTTGASGTVRKTTNGGATWDSLFALTANSINSISIQSPNNIYLGATRTGSSTLGYSLMLIRSTDYGQTWVDVSVADMGTVQGVFFWDANTGWAATQNSGKVYYTTNGGITWANSTTDALVVPNNILFISPTVGFVTNNNNGKIFKTTDGGATWVANEVGTESFNQLVISADNSVAMVVGDYGSIYVSYDLGGGWMPAMAATTRETLKKITFFDATTGYAAGGSTVSADALGQVLKTTNGGEYWEVMPFNFTFQVTSFFMASELVWYVGTGNNKLFKTTDGGLNFSQLTSPVTGTTHDYNAIEFVGSVGYAAGLTGKIIKTTDDGATWSLLTFPNTSTINDMKVLDANTVIAMVGATTSQITTDGGATWTALNLNQTTGTFYKVEFYNSTFGIAMGYSSPATLISVTTDGGATWTKNDAVASLTGVTNARSLLIKDVNTWWIGDLSGNIGYTKDGGATWFQAKKILNHGLYSAAMCGDKLYFAGSGGAIIQGYGDPEVPVALTSFNATINGNNVNLSWTTATELNNKGFEIQRKFENDEWNVVSFVNGNGSSTQITSYSYTDQVSLSGKYQYRLKQIDFDGTYEFSSVIETVVGAPTEFALEQNYPNPFNPSTTISYSVAEKGFVSLKVYNLIGQVVAVLANENMEAGTYTAQFNASNLSTGAYFYELKAGNFTSVKKMMLIK